MKCEACVVWQQIWVCLDVAFIQKFPGSRRNIVRLRQLPESSFNPARRWIALLARARWPRIQDGKDKKRMKWKIILVDARWSLPAFAYLSLYLILCCLQSDFCGERNVMNVVIWSSPDIMRRFAGVCARDSRDWWQNVQLAKMLFLCLHISSLVAVATPHYSHSTALAVSAGRGCPEGEWCCLLVLFGVLMYLCGFIMDDVLIFGPLWTLKADFVCVTHLSLHWSLQSTRNQVQRARGFCVWECLRRD